MEVLGFSAMLMLAYQAVWDVSLLDDPVSQPLEIMKERTDHVVLSQGSTRVGLEKVHMRGNEGDHRASVCQAPSPTCSLLKRHLRGPATTLVGTHTNHVVLCKLGSNLQIHCSATERSLETF